MTAHLRPDPTDRIAALSEDLERAADARVLCSTDIWAKAWDATEKELLEQFLACGPKDDDERYRFQIGIKAARAARAFVEHKSKTETGLLKQLQELRGEGPTIRV